MHIFESLLSFFGEISNLNWIVIVIPVIIDVIHEVALAIITKHRKHQVADAVIVIENDHQFVFSARELAFDDIVLGQNVFLIIDRLTDDIGKCGNLICESRIIRLGDNRDGIIDKSGDRTANFHIISIIPNKVIIRIKIVQRIDSVGLFDRGVIFLWHRIDEANVFFRDFVRR